MQNSTSLVKSDLLQHFKKNFYWPFKVKFSYYFGKLLVSIFRRLAIKISWRPSKAVPVSLEYDGIQIFYDEEKEAMSIFRGLKTDAMTSVERIVTLYQQVQYLDRNKIVGSLVECGVWKGAMVGLMAKSHLIQSSNPDRELHLFDSFEGLPEPDATQDGDASISYAHEKAAGKLIPIGKCVGTLEESRNLIEKKIGYPIEKIHYHKGWFENVIPTDSKKMGPIALLRLDGDWYESTRVCLDYLYPLVSEGGVIVIDDYGHWSGCKKAVDEFLLKQSKPVYLHHIDYSARYWIKN